MIRSLFARLMVTYFIIILVTLAGLGLLLSTFFEDYFFTKRTNELIREGEALNPYMELYALGLIDRRSLYNYFMVIDRFLNTTIWITDENGSIWTSYSSQGYDMEQWEDQRISVEEFMPILEGETITRVGRFGERFHIPVLTVGMPLRINNRIRGAILLHSPVSEINVTLYDLYTNIWKSAMLSAILSIALLYWISARISMPLVQMNEISREIAKGNFRRRVEIYREDETGQLAVNFNAMADALEKLEEMRRSFVANVSHELRSPLTSIRGYIHGIMDKTIEPRDQDKYLAVVLDETDRLNRLINELLDLARIEAGQLPLKLEPIDINELIRRVIIAKEESISKKDIDLSVEFEEEIFFVQADMDKIQQVIINLLDNAIKFCDEKGHICIKTWRHKEKVYIKIQDNGPGISREDIVHIWEPFYQADKSRTPQKEGTGLGLSIVKKIIDSHGEDIWINSKEEEGTAFIFSLDYYRK